MDNKSVYVAIVLLVFPLWIWAITIGSDTIPSRQGLLFFSQEDTDNKIRGFAWCQQGIILEDYRASCSFDSLYPVSKQLNVSGGFLILENDLVLTQSTKVLNMGRIKGQYKGFCLPETTDIFRFPYYEKNCNVHLSKCASYQLGNDAYSIDWNANDSYIAVGTQSATGSDLYIFSFDGSTFSPVFQENIGRDVNSVRWHPSLQYLSVGYDTGSGNEFRVLKHNTSNDSVTEVDGIDLSANCQATEWHPSGNFILIGTTSGNLQLYSFDSSTENLSQLQSFNVSPSTHIERNSLSWAPGRNYVAVGSGTSSTPGSPEIRIYGFDGTSLSLTTSVHVGEHAEHMEWCPTGTQLAVGIENGPTALRLYDASQDTLSQNKLIEIQRYPEANGFLSIHWDPSGKFLTSGHSTHTVRRFKVYLFDRQEAQIIEMSNQDDAGQIDAVRWSHDGNFIACGRTVGSTKFVEIYKVSRDPYLFENTALVMQSDVLVQCELQFLDNCCIYGNGSRLILGDQGSLVVRPTGTLQLRDVIVENVHDYNLRCLTNAGSIALRDAALLVDSDYTFSQGSILFEKDVAISGTGKVIYQTCLSSTVASRSTLLFTFGITFSYAPLCSKRNLLHLSDNTSMVCFDECSLVSTSTGLIMSQGTVCFDNKVTVSSQARCSHEAIVFDASCNVNLLSGANIEMFGHITG